jgi:cytochrome c biogenesis protein CcdA
MVYFYSKDCPHCITIIEETLNPLRDKYGEQLQLKMVEISDPANYELLIRAEEMLEVSPEERGLPTLVVGEQVLIGEYDIPEQLPCVLDSCLEVGGTAWPDIPGLDRIPVEGGGGLDVGLGPLVGAEGVQPCGSEEAERCEEPAAIWAAYFYEVGCQNCGRAEHDIRYVRSQYPQLLVEEHNVQADAALAEWLADRFGVPERYRLATPSLFVGDEYLIGTDITPGAITALVEKYATTGAERTWAKFDVEAGERSIVERFRSFSVLAVIFAGLVDGVNPCAFATLIFFVSYLTLSGHKGRQVLFVGGAFTLGVFLAYLAVGLGLFRVLDLLGSALTTVGRWVYVLTAVLCAGLAVVSFLDFLKARRGEIGDMALNLPHGLRMRINAVIRKRRRSGAAVAGAFITGLAVSILELACTGQVYLPTIVFVVSQPELRVRALSYLVLYNLLFILPLAVVFVLAHYGANSKQLTRFLERNAATVKLGMALLFAALAAWLVVSTLA